MIGEGIAGWLLGGAAAVLVALALLARGDVGLAVPLALGATVLASLVALIALGPLVRWPRPAPPPPLPDPAVRLLEAIRGGAFVRRNAVAHLRALERRMRVPIPPISPEEEERVIALSTPEFLRWISARIADLEAAT